MLLSSALHSVLADMLGDDTKRLYFLFATSVIAYLEALNSAFQSTDADPDKLASELKQHH